MGDDAFSYTYGTCCARSIKRVLRDLLTVLVSHSYYARSTDDPLAYGTVRKNIFSLLLINYFTNFTPRLRYTQLCFELN